MAENHSAANLEKKYLGIPMEELIEAVIDDKEDSQETLWYILSVRLADQLKSVYHGVFQQDSSSWEPYEDCISDFYLYLAEGAPNNKEASGKYYYLKTIRERQKAASWLLVTFKRFLTKQQETALSLQESAEKYKVEWEYENRPHILYDMVPVAYSIALFMQDEPVENRFIMLRSIWKQLLKGESWVNLLSDQEVAALLGITYDNYRAKSSRSMSKIREIIRKMNSKTVRQLNANSRVLVDDLCGSRISINTIFESLLSRTEKELPTYELIQERREQLTTTEHYLCDAEYIMSMPEAEQECAMPCDYSPRPSKRWLNFCMSTDAIGWLPRSKKSELPGNRSRHLHERNMFTNERSVFATGFSEMLLQCE